MENSNLNVQLFSNEKFDETWRLKSSPVSGYISLRILDILTCYG